MTRAVSGNGKSRRKVHLFDGHIEYESGSQRVTGSFEMTDFPMNWARQKEGERHDESFNTGTRSRSRG